MTSKICVIPGQYHGDLRLADGTHLAGLVREVGVPSLVFGGLDVELEKGRGKPEYVVAMCGRAFAGRRPGGFAALLRVFDG